MFGDPGDGFHELAGHEGAYRSDCGIVRILRTIPRPEKGARCQRPGSWEGYDGRHGTVLALTQDFHI